AFTFLLLLITLSTTIIAYDNNVKSEKISIQKRIERVEYDNIKRLNKRQQRSLSFVSATTIASSISTTTTGSSATNRAVTTFYSTSVTSSTSVVTSATTSTITNLPTLQETPSGPSTLVNVQQAPHTITGSDIPTVLPDLPGSGNRI
ncbi:12274_t:CDS:1, partial [Dentiscutata heterogama]